MEKKTKHRILGSLVLIGLVVILLPFFQGNKEFTTETTLVKAPPFPDQSMQAMISDPSQPDEYAIEPEQQIATTNRAQATPVTPAQPATTVVQSSSPQEPLPVISKPDQKVMETTAADDDSGTQLGDDVVQISKSGSIAKKPVVSSLTKVSSVNIKPSAMNNAWVVQLGSFKDKTNAVRLVNRLRTSGYPAFIQKVTTAFGEHTRVYVGPQDKKETAKALAQKLEHEFFVRAIVISYKPLTL